MNDIKRKTIIDIKKQKDQKDPIVCLTSYTAPMTKILDKYCDILLVGDTLGMTIYGMKNTLPVTVRMMIDHGKAVVEASNKALIVVDLPFGSYEKSPEQAFNTASRIITRTGCNAVKFECNKQTIETVKFLTSRGVAVMGHIGLLPQHINTTGSYKCHGKDPRQAKEILETALELEKAGCFAIVTECITANLAETITNKLKIPVIGIGASSKCDGQVLVNEDMLGIEGYLKPKFVKNYSNLTEQIEKAVSNYRKEVKERSFPSKEHMFLNK